MTKRGKYLTHFFVVVFIATLILFSYYASDATEYLKKVANENLAFSVFIYIFLFITTTVIAPLTSIPIALVGAAVFGSLPTAFYNIIGWTLGAVAAFLIARYFKEFVLKYIVSFDKVTKYEERIPNKMKFWYLVLLRMFIPTDILSYAVGILSTIKLLPYTLATLIGVIPFSFVFAYGGSALFEGNYTNLINVGIIAIILLSGAFYMTKNRFNSNIKHSWKK